MYLCAVDWTLRAVVHVLLVFSFPPFSKGSRRLFTHRTTPVGDGMGPTDERKDLLWRYGSGGSIKHRGRLVRHCPHEPHDTTWACKNFISARLNPGTHHVCNSPRRMRLECQMRRCFVSGTFFQSSPLGAVQQGLPAHRPTFPFWKTWLGACAGTYSVHSRQSRHIRVLIGQMIPPSNLGRRHARDQHSRARGWPIGGEEL